MSEKGTLSINSENILPIIKKWLYSDSDIFVRELVSNASDAITKLRKLVDLGEAPHIPADAEYKIEVILDRESGAIIFRDNGIGMSAEEIKKYINEIAFSGANAFLEKYKDKMEGGGDIIGHFGLGFYSAFMAADKVTIESLSYLEGAAPARWECSGGVEFEMSEGSRDSRGTEITLHIGEDGKDFLEEYKLRGVLTKYCGFIPSPLYFESRRTEEELKEEAEHVHDENCEHSHEGDEPKPINDTHPLWLKQPNECADDEYKEFYHKVFMDFAEPLFWIHLNMDYPFRLKGILYFPKLKHELESIEGQVKLYNNQVFIADNVKEVIPEFLLLLKGALDCPDLPLNVSRSFLQNDGYVSKMSGYITKKVADKLTGLFKKDREEYAKTFPDIAPFVKYGCIKDRGFYDKIKDSVLYKNISGGFVTIAEYLEAAKEKHENTVYYVSNENQQARYIKMFRDFGMDAVVLDTNLDAPFISYLESYDYNVKFRRIDSDLAGALKDSAPSKEAAEETEALFKKAFGGKELKISVEALQSADIPALMLLSEQSRRMSEMSHMFGGGLPGFAPANDETLVLNSNNRLIKALLALKDDESRADDVTMICEQVRDLARLSHKPLDVEEMNRFMARSGEILERLAGNAKEET
ncbi:MAG: molecular chaperone HtpG [Clostridiales bacterium]|jgi:molecular chaperone HtpG|nr:molecular chaperone HtpG [Clostridiales bacterium]